LNYTHKTVFLNGAFRSGENFASDIENMINQLEGEGWEFVTLEGLGSTEMYLVFRREQVLRNS